MGPSSVVLSQLDSGRGGRIANTLSQVQVLFDGNPAPLIYVSAQQISADFLTVSPGSLQRRFRWCIRAATSGSFQKPIAPSAPGIFTADSSGPGSGGDDEFGQLLQHGSESAIPGSYVTFYLTGEGQTNPLGSERQQSQRPLQMWPFRSPV